MNGFRWLERSWNPSWTVEKILIGLMSFMYEAGGMPFLRRAELRRTPFRLAPFSSPKRIDGGLLQRPPTLMHFGAHGCCWHNVRLRTRSMYSCFKRRTKRRRRTTSVSCAKWWPEKRATRREGRGLQSTCSSQACRSCLVDSGDLVAPCECKGSGQWVHLGCLRQWQKSVLLTQSTHPKYQTRIDEICGLGSRAGGVWPRQCLRAAV